MPAGLILWFMGLTAAFGMPARIWRAHYVLNEKTWRSFLARFSQQKSGNGLPWIEKQSDLGEFVYGRHNSFLSRLLLGGRRLSASENACEVIAVYNALLALEPESRPLFPSLIEAFEKRGISFGGYFGTSFEGICRFLREKKLPMVVVKGKKITAERLKEAERQGAAACIMMTENRAGHLGDMVHTICISQETTARETLKPGTEGAVKTETEVSAGEKGGIKKWRAHNDYEGSRLSDSLSDAVFGYHNYAGRPLGVILLYPSDIPV